MPTCGPTAPIGEVRATIDARDLCVVVARDGIVAGVIEKSMLDAPDGQPVDAVMRTDPTTVRPSEEGAELQSRMRDRSVAATIVTRPDGTLVGAYFAPSCSEDEA